MRRAMHEILPQPTPKPYNSLQLPRSQHALADPEEQEQFKKTSGHS
jgi:hypothetical protein